MSENRVVITGGNQSGAVFGAGTVQQVNNGSTGAAITLEDLRAVLTAHADAIVARGGDPEIRAEIRKGVDETAAELAKPKPDGRIVKARWTGVLALIGGLIAANADAAQIWQFILEHFGK